MKGISWEKCVEFHGHECQGLAIGYKACEALIKKMDISLSKDDDIICVTESHACFVDAIQTVLGCSFGKGNLVYRDRGKLALSFFNRKSRECIRIVFKSLPRIKDKRIFIDYVLNADVDDLFEYKHPGFHIPERRRVFDTIPCQLCGEIVAENKIRLMNNKRVCLDCFKE